MPQSVVVVECAIICLNIKQDGYLFYNGHNFFYLWNKYILKTMGYIFQLKN